MSRLTPTDLRNLRTMHDSYCRNRNSAARHDGLLELLTGAVLAIGEDLFEVAATNARGKQFSQSPGASFAVPATDRVFTETVGQRDTALQNHDLEEKLKAAIADRNHYADRCGKLFAELEQLKFAAREQQQQPIPPPPQAPAEPPELIATKRDDLIASALQHLHASQSHGGMVACNEVRLRLVLSDLIAAALMAHYHQEKAKCSPPSKPAHSVTSSTVSSA